MMDRVSQLIIPTKLNQPPVRPDLVLRQHLHELLTAGLSRRLTLVSAPAGYGKTTLVSAWLKQFNFPFAQREARAVISLSSPGATRLFPYWSLWMVCGLNPDLQVLNAEGKPIPGLYAVGNASGDFFANDYPITCADVSHGRAFAFGWPAGEKAAAL